MIVLDASVVVKALNGDETGYEQARKLVRGSVAVPEWLFVEVANVLATKTKYSIEEAEEVLGLVYDIGFRVEAVDREMLVEAVALAKGHGVAVYDMIYAVLAKRLGVKLVTADANFKQKTGFDFVELFEQKTFKVA